MVNSEKTILEFETKIEKLIYSLDEFKSFSEPNNVKSNEKQ